MANDTYIQNVHIQISHSSVTRFNDRTLTVIVVHEMTFENYFWFKLMKWFIHFQFIFFILLSESIICERERLKIKMMKTKRRAEADEEEIWSPIKLSDFRSVWRWNMTEVILYLFCVFRHWIEHKERRDREREKTERRKANERVHFEYG